MSGCVRCDGAKHYLSLCLKRLQEVKETSAGACQQRSSNTVPLSKRGRRKIRKTLNKSKAQLTKSAEPEEVLQAETQNYGDALNDGELSRYFVSGWARIVDAKTGELQMVQILLDTGTDRSFIQKKGWKKADKLELPLANAIELSVHISEQRLPGGISMMSSP
ncbi:unnamed protein product [Haemonchus placei]|uniref:Peptidase A2 domain-containing protein n=1 Tax=Haemonchus placei TaxID=6290 RepID=A0A0N4W6B6_HAEPC|nr:unnamed protein product [Haemonchus placei]